MHKDIAKVTMIAN